MPAAHLLVLGTHNRKKGAELSELFGPWGLQVVTLDGFPAALDVVEGIASFAINARLKATQQALHLGQWVLGEDSGIAVDALGGAPGVCSARFAGPEATDADNNHRLLTDLKSVPAEKRTAHYVCHMTLSDPQGTVRAESEERCCGRILHELHGTHGFGYDPLFEIVEYHRTFGQLGPAVKRAISHRSRAARALLPQLQKLIELGQWRAD